jgi:hypothetical protein
MSTTKNDVGRTTVDPDDSVSRPELVLGDAPRFLWPPREHGAGYGDVLVSFPCQHPRRFAWPFAELYERVRGSFVGDNPPSWEFRVLREEVRRRRWIPLVCGGSIEITNGT